MAPDIVRISRFRWLLALTTFVAAACSAAGPLPSDAPSPTASVTSAPSPAGGTSASPGATTLIPDLVGKFDVGGHSLYIECFGTAGPVIVFDSGSGSAVESWKRSPAGFMGLVDNGYRRCLYDRSNIGKSDRDPSTPRTSATAAEELHALLVATGLPAPYVLVGRSFGGYNVRLFAAMYPQDVLALVMLETLTPEFHMGMEALLTTGQWAEEVVGVQSYEPPLDVIASGILVAAAELPDVPLLVIAGTRWHTGNGPWPASWPGTKLNALWDISQVHLSESVPRGRLVVFEGGDHSLQISQPERLAREINDFLATL